MGAAIYRTCLALAFNLRIEGSVKTHEVWFVD